MHANRLENKSPPTETAGSTRRIHTYLPHHLGDCRYRKTLETIIIYCFDWHLHSREVAIRSVPIRTHRTPSGRKYHILWRGNTVEAAKLPLLALQRKRSSKRARKERKEAASTSAQTSGVRKRSRAKKTGKRGRLHKWPKKKPPRILASAPDACNDVVARSRPLGSGLSRAVH